MVCVLTFRKKRSELKTQKPLVISITGPEAPQLRGDTCMHDRKLWLLGSRNLSEE
jgi:hypothetical protein